jgi:hypothetical protein
MDGSSRANRFTPLERRAAAELNLDLEDDLSYAYIQQELPRVRAGLLKAFTEDDLALLADLGFHLAGS